MNAAKFGRGRMIGVIRRLSAANATRGRKSGLVHLQVERWRELKVIAALTDSTLDRLLQPVGSTHPTGYALMTIKAQQRMIQVAPARHDDEAA
jgi:phosphopantothenoylcysteine synthetase/decarboxylase